MQSSIIKLAGVLLLAITMVSCDQATRGPELVKTHDYSGKQFPVTVMVFDSERELNNYIHSQKLLTRDEQVQGLALWSLNKDDRSVMNHCTIYVVEPNGAQDYKELTTWGHELVHCVYGSFHKDGIR